MLMCSPRDQGNIIELMAVPNTNVYVPDYSKKIKQDKLVDGKETLLPSGRRN